MFSERWNFFASILATLLLLTQADCVEQLEVISPEEFTQVMCDSEYQNAPDCLCTVRGAAACLIIGLIGLAGYRFQS